MQYLICQYCEHENCMKRARECLRHKTITMMIINRLSKELPKMHERYTEIRKEMINND